MSKEKKDHVDYCLLGQRVRRARMKLNLTQEVLAEKVGVSIPTISHIETGTNKVSLELFVSIANALNVTPGGPDYGQCAEADSFLYERHSGRAERLFPR